MSETHELKFSADFAARVMREVGAITTRRRRVRFAVGVTSVALLIGAVSFGTVQQWVRPAPAQHVPQMVASIQPEIPFSPRRQATLLNIMFPHADAVAEFYDQYGDSQESLEDDAVFFPSAAEVAENDS